MEGQAMGVFEAVLLNLDGFLTEGTTSNLFFARAGRLCTPALSCGLLEGVTREVVAGLARRAGYRVREGRYRLADLRRADEIFLTSTTLEIVAVTRVVSGLGKPVVIWKRPGPGPIARSLHGLFRRLL